MPLREGRPERGRDPKGSGRSRRRVPWGTLSRQEIVGAAAQTIQAGGYEQMTIRSLAADLGVAPMTLYRHVRDKDDLLDEVTAKLLAECWPPVADPGDWKAWVAEAAERLRDLLVTQPAALHVYLRHPVVSPPAIDRMEAMLGVLRGAGFDDQSARRAYGAIHTYTIGFAALESSRDRWTAAEHTDDEIADVLGAFTTPRQFADGLSYLIEGIHRAGGAPDGRGP